MGGGERGGGTKKKHKKKQTKKKRTKDIESGSGRGRGRGSEIISAIDQSDACPSDFDPHSRPRAALELELVLDYLLPRVGLLLLLLQQCAPLRLGHVFQQLVLVLEDGSHG